MINNTVFRLKPHSITVYYNLSNFVYLLIIPLIQQILFRPHSLFQKIGNTVINLIFIISLFFLAFFEYKSISYTSGKKNIKFKKGMVFTRLLSLHKSSVDCLYLSQGILLRIFKGSHCFQGTPSIKDRRNIKFILKSKDTHNITKAFLKGNQAKPLYKSKFFKVLIMTLMQSNAFTGLLILAPFVNKVGTVLGQKYSEQLYDRVNLTHYFIAFGLPPAMAYLAGLLFTGYVVSIVINLLNESRFTLTKNGSNIIITKGIIKKSFFMTNRKNINAITVKQSLFMYITKIYSILLHTIKSGTPKKENRLLVPMTTEKSKDALIVCIKKTDLKFKKIIKPPKKTIKSFLLLPFIYCIAVILMWLMFKKFNFTAAFADVFLLYFTAFGFVWLFFRLLAYSHSSFCINNKCVKIQSFKGFNLYTTYVFLKDIGKVKIKQNPFQQLFGMCHLYVYICDEKKRKFTVKHLKYKDVVKILGLHF